MTTPHSLFRLSSSIWNVPQLITQEDFTPILQYLSSRNLGEINFAMHGKDEMKKPKKPMMAGKIGEVKVEGSLTYRPVQSMCGEVGTSYQGLLVEVEELISEGASTIIMTHSSGGGEAQMCFSTANRLRELADESGVKLITYIDTISASASLALGVVSDEVIIHPEARTGSIGCVCAILDKSKALANAGLKPIYIASTKGKTPFENDGSFSEDFLEALQEDVSELGMQFAEHVEKYTNVPMKNILEMDAKIFKAKKALELGLVNKIMNHQEFAKYISNL